MTLPYSLAIVWHERGRYFPAALAVAFSAMLIALQGGMLLGMLHVSSRPIDHAGADIWVASRGISGLGYGESIPVSWKNRLLVQPEVESAEEYLFAFGELRKPNGGAELCYIIGTRLGPDALGAPREIRPFLREGLQEPGAVVMAASEAAELGLPALPGSRSEVAGHRVRVIGLVHDFQGEGLMPGLYGSVRTVRLLSALAPGQTTYLLARCRSPQQASAVAARLRAEYPDMEALTSAEFRRRTWAYWLTRTRAGSVLGFSCGLGLLVGAVITSQTLRSATAASLREYAVLRALGVSRGHLARLVLAQSFHVAAAGLALALPATLVMAELARPLGVEIVLPAWLLGGAITLKGSPGSPDVRKL